MRSLLLTFFVTLSGLSGMAQIDPGEVKKHVIIKYFPLSLYDVDNTVQAGLEIPLSRRFSIQEDLGYGHTKFSLWYLADGSNPDRQILKSRTQLRFYFYERDRVRAFVAGEYLFKRVTNSRVQWAGRDCANGDCGYFEMQNVKIGRFVNAGHAKAGWQFYFPHRLTVEVFGGVGLREVKVRSLTPSAERISVRDSWLSLGAAFNSSVPYTETIPSISLGFSIGFALGKFRKPAQETPLR